MPAAQAFARYALAIPAAGATVAARPAPLDDAARAVHALNRLGYGPRPGDVERVQKMGLDKWIDQQLHLGGLGGEAAKRR